MTGDTNSAAWGYKHGISGDTSDIFQWFVINCSTWVRAFSSYSPCVVVLFLRKIFTCKRPYGYHDWIWTIIFYLGSMVYFFCNRTPTILSTRATRTALILFLLTNNGIFPASNLLCKPFWVVHESFRNCIWACQPSDEKTFPVTVFLFQRFRKYHGFTLGCTTSDWT